MGSITRFGRSDRFIKEFGADLVAHDRVAPEKTWRVVNQGLVVDDRFEMPVMEFTLQRVGTDETLVLRSDDFFFDSESHDPAELAQDLAARLSIPEEQAIARLRQADLYWEPEVPDLPEADQPEDSSKAGPPQPRAAQRLPLTASPPGSQPVIVIETVGGHFNGIYGNVELRMVLVGWEENRSTSRFDEDEEPIEVDGEEAFVKEFLVGPDDGIDDKVARALLAAEVDMPGLPTTEAEGTEHE